MNSFTIDSLLSKHFIITNYAKQDKTVNPVILITENHWFTNSEKQIEKSYAYLRVVCLSSCCVEISAKSEHWASNTVQSHDTKNKLFNINTIAKSVPWK